MNKEYGDEPEHAIQKRQGFLPSKIARAPGQDDGAGQSNNENLGISATHNRGQHSLSMEEQGSEKPFFSRSRLRSCMQVYSRKKKLWGADMVQDRGQGRLFGTTESGSLLRWRRS